MDSFMQKLDSWLQCKDAARMDQQGQLLNSKAGTCLIAHELVNVLQQYPGGLTEAAMLTQLQVNINKRVEALKQQQQLTSTHRLARTRPLITCARLTAKKPTEMVIQAAIDAITPAGGKGSPVMRLTDSSNGSSPVGMFVHSQHTWLMEGPYPLLTAGRRIRAATTVCCPLGCSGMPPLMPTTALAVCLPPEQWQHMLSQQQLPGNFQQQYRLQDVLAGGVEALQQEQCCLNGWLVATVSSIGEVESSYNADCGASSRTWTTCSITLQDSTNNSSSSSHIRWLLLDEAVRYSCLLRPGEQLAMYCPTVRKYQQQQSNSPPELILECSGSVLLLVRADDSSSADEYAGAVDAGTTSSMYNSNIHGAASQRACWFDSVTALAAGQQNVVLCGVASQVQRRASSSKDNKGKAAAGPVISCMLADNPAGLAAGAAVPVQMHFKHNTTNKVLQQLRDGHTVLLVNASYKQVAGAGAEASHVVTWHEGTPGAAAQDLSCMPGLLATPCLRQMVDLQQLCCTAAGCNRSQQADLLQTQHGPVMVRAVLKSVCGVPCHVHRACGRVSQPSSGVDDGVTCSQPGTAAVAMLVEPGLWTCPFCSMECSSSDVEAACTGSVVLTAAADADAASQDVQLQVAVDESAWRGLMTGAACLDVQNKHNHALEMTAAACEGRTVIAAVYQGSATGQQQQKQWCISAWKLV